MAAKHTDPPTRSASVFLRFYGRSAAVLTVLLFARDASATLLLSSAYFCFCHHCIHPVLRCEHQQSTNSRGCGLARTCISSVIVLGISSHSRSYLPPSNSKTHHNQPAGPIRHVCPVAKYIASKECRSSCGSSRLVNPCRYVRLPLSDDEDASRCVPGEGRRAVRYALGNVLADREKAAGGVCRSLYRTHTNVQTGEIGQDRWC